MSARTISIEMNEINFEFVETYIEKGHLPNFARLLRENRLVRTRSERVFTDIEPWIQWPTYYTGKTLEEHGIYRLGDSTGADIPQIWEKLEKAGRSVGAISPMNAANRCDAPRFFVPDPWTVTPVSGGPEVARLYEVIRKAVNNNAHDSGLDRADLLVLLRSLARSARIRNYPGYLRLLAMSRKYKWAKALFLDQFLSDLFLSLWNSEAPDYASLFLNAGAHIQHHHMYESAVYEGRNRNPVWYSASAGDGVDPLLVAYTVYDRILGDFLRLDGVRLMVTTGLSQVPNQVMKYQYRFKNHAQTLGRVGLRGFTIIPRMSRDFLLEFADAGAAAAAQEVLLGLQVDGEAFIEVDNRGASLFCKICYFGEPEKLTRVTHEGRSFDMSDEVALVSIENGIHRTIGFHVDTGDSAGAQDEVPLAALHDKILGIYAAS